MSDRLLTLDQFGAMLHLSKDWVGKACREGRLRHVTVGSGTKRQRRLVYASEVDRLIRNQTHDPIELHRIAKVRTRGALQPVEQRY